MSILVPLVASGVTLTEVPDHIAIYFELGNCTKGCRGCHSPHLSNQQVLALTPIEGLEGIAETHSEKGADAILVMGGTTNSIPVEKLVSLLERLGRILPVCLYSGSDDAERDFAIAEHAGIQWLKTGSYKEERGGLTSPTTNQRFYECVRHYRYTRDGVYLGTHVEFIDKTYLFQDKQKGDT